MIKLRPYQEQAFEATLLYWSRGGQKPLISMATGLGKAFLAIALGVHVGEFDTDTPKRVAFLAHTKELIEQPYDSLVEYAPYLADKYYGKRPARGIVRASRNQANAQFLFATMQTLAGRDGPRLDDVLSHGAFDLVILDEAHHSAAKSYADIIVPKILEANPDTKLLGLTATPARSDGKALDTVFDDIVYTMNIRHGINGGWLKPINAHTVKTEVSLESVPRYMGDFHQSKLANALSIQNWTEIISDAYFENDGPNHYAISFMPSVEMGRELCAKFRDQDVPAASIDNEMVIDECGEVHSGNGRKYERARQRVIDAYRNGAIKVLGGYSVLLEGFDAPNTDMILQGRPTESEVLLTQLIGRGLRMPPGIARVVHDSEKSAYLVQRNGEDRWHEHPENKMPYATECLVLDFTTKDTPILLSGSLAGNRVPEATEVDKEVEAILVTTPVPTELDRILKEGEGTKYFKRNFFKQSSDNYTFWPGDNTMSVYLGAQGEGEHRLANALFIYPRRISLIESMNTLLDVLYESSELVHSHTEEETIEYIKQAAMYKHVFSGFTLWKLSNIPVKITQRGQYTGEIVEWRKQNNITVQYVAWYPDHRMLWEDSLRMSQELSVGGFFVDKKRQGARNTTTTKQLDLLFNEKILAKTGREFPNVYHTLPKQVNDAFDAVPGLERYKIVKPLRKLLSSETNVVVSGMINHVGIYSTVMLQKLGYKLVQAQQLYNYWMGLWHSQHS